MSVVRQARRSSGVIATVFGCTGFLGRYVVNRLARTGAQVVVPYRGEPKATNHLKVTGDFGQIVPIPFSIRDKKSVELAVSHSNIVINLIGRHYATRNFSLEEANVTSAAIIAEAAAKSGAQRFIQASAIHADEKSPSEFARIKAKAEKVVREQYPSATIIRSTVLYGWEDRLLNKFGYLSQFFFLIPLLYRPNAYLQPLFVGDLAQAYVKALEDNATRGKTFEIGGKESFIVKNLVHDIVYHQTKRTNRFIIPFSANTSKKLAYWFERARTPLYSVPEVEYFQLDNIVSPSAETIPGIDYTLMSEIAPNILRLYRKPIRFNQPIEN